MDRIAAGEMTKGEVVGESRDLLHKTWSEIDETKEDLAKVVWKGMDEDRILGPCKVCEEAGRTKEDGSPQHAAHHPRQKIGQTLRRLQRLDPRRPRVLRPDLPAAPARRRLQTRGTLLDLRADAAAQSPALPRPALEPLPQRRLRVDAGDEETPRRARSGESGERSDGEKAASRGRRGQGAREKNAKKSAKPTPRPAGANAPKQPPKAEAAGGVRLARGSRRLGQEHAGAVAGRGARPRDAADPRAGWNRRRRADPRAARRSGARDRLVRRAAALLRRPRRPARPGDPPRRGSRPRHRRRPLRRLQRRLPGGRARARHEPRALAHRHGDRRPLARPHRPPPGRPRGRPRPRRGRRPLRGRGGRAAARGRRGLRGDRPDRARPGGRRRRVGQRRGGPPAGHGGRP